MSILDQLTYSEQPSGNDPATSAKATLLKNLEAQLEAATLMVEGKPSNLTERQKWFNRRDADGKLLFGVKVSNKVIELQKGKPFIVVGEDKTLPSIVDKMIAAVKAGELDERIEARVKERQKQKRQ
jgi:6-phosphogluconate dehydrogenase (decarboxylating)